MTIYDFLNAALWRIRNLFYRFQLLIQFKINSAGVYEPDPWHPGNNPDLRDSLARADAILRRLPDEPLSVIDIGCQIGYFTFALARRGGFCLGIDYARNEIMIAQALAAVHRVGNATFAQMEINAETAASLPRADVVVCLSVYHHWVRKLGRDGAEKILRNLASRASRFLVFDTGQPDETGAEWAEKLSFMRPDIDVFLRTFLQELGFSQVDNLGTFRTSISSVPRHLYLATRSG
jgi:SAM-dependent methyltransferase